MAQEVGADDFGTVLRDRADRPFRGVSLQQFSELSRVADDLVLPLAVGVSDRRDNLTKRGQSGMGLRRKIGASEKRFTLRRQECREGPSPLTCHGLDRHHVHGVDVRSLLPVHLDADEALVHELGGVRILERLLFHHVAPMARRVPDRE